MRYLLTSLLCVFMLSLTAQVDCPNTYDGNADGAVTINDLLDLLAVFGDTDTDSDGIWDSIDDCIDLTACNYANDPTEACAYIDVLGVCGGGCEGDGDGDGICDSEDDCVGVLDECGVCNGPGATEVVIESITILYDSLYAEQIDEWLVFEIGADTVFNYTCAPNCGDPVTYYDYDYSTVLIGDQCWFSENLNTFKYNNGDAIPNIQDGEEWISLDQTETGAWAYYNNDPDYNWEGGPSYTKLYNWYAVNDTRSLCPSGWHVPTYSEWTVLAELLGGNSPAGTYMKADYGWGGSAGGSNLSGFSGLPGGWRNPIYGTFESFDSGKFWSSSLLGSDARYKSLSNTYSMLSNGSTDSRSGMSVRCLRDYIDDCGVPYGDNSCLDDCGVPYGDNSTCGCDGIPNYVVSQNGYDYSTVQIGDQCWFTENCRILVNVTPAYELSNGGPHCCVLGYEGYYDWEAINTENYETYGVLYNYDALEYYQVCPSGWHIPSDEDWMELEMTLGMSESDAAMAGSDRGTDEGFKMKSTSGWDYTLNGSNESGFNALPGGMAGYDYGFCCGGYGVTTFWSSSNGPNGKWCRQIFESPNQIQRITYNPGDGASARCVRD